MPSGEIIATIIVASLGSTGLGGLIMFLIDRKIRQRQSDAAASKDEADAQLTAVEAGGRTLKMAFDMLDRQESELKRQQCEIDDLGRTVTKQTGEISRFKGALMAFGERVNYLMGGIAVLIGQIKDTNQAPCWQPDDWQPPDVDKE